MTMINIRPWQWKKVSKNGIPIPIRCPDCKSRKTVLTTYKNGKLCIECESCYQVIKEL